jgi:PAS domain S-box-containing protein
MRGTPLRVVKGRLVTRYQALLGYLVAIIASTCVLLARMALDSQLAEQARLLPFVIAVIAAAWVGGLKPGLLATFLGTYLGVYFIVPPADSLRIERLADGLNAATFVLVGVTVSALIEALHRARRSERDKQFRVLADSVSQLVWMAWPDGYRFWFNRRWYEYTGSTPSQSEGSGWQSFCEPAALRRLLETWRAASEQGTPWEETYLLRGADGQSRWFLVRAVPMKNAHGEVERWFGTSTDIHDRIEAERALHEADMRKDRYLSTLAHELRNPLAPISNALQLWPRVKHDPDEMEELRVVMQRQTKQLVRLVDDLLDVARISKGKIALRRKPVDVQGVVKEAASAIEPLVNVAGGKLTITTQPTQVVVDGDPMRLLQVFSNLLNNALKYSGPKPRIEVDVRAADTAVSISVRDHGVGISESLQAKIFEPFFQVERTISSAQGGLGIGLTLAKELATLHGGDIVVDSEGANRGSTFTVTLPTIDMPVAESSNSSPLSPKRVIPRHRILVVDDIADCADTLAKLLEMHGQDATTLHNGADAISWIVQNHPDAVLLDIAMPGMDGYEVARRLRENAQFDSTTLIALTGYGQPDDQRRALQGGFDFHLQKPVRWQMLETILVGLPARKPPAEPVAK